jgi:hypothetical protein
MSNFTYHPEQYEGKGFGITEEGLKHLDPREMLGEIERNARTEIHALHLDRESIEIYLHALAEGYGAGWDAALGGILDLAEVHQSPDD